MESTLIEKTARLLGYRINEGCTQEGLSYFTIISPDGRVIKLSSVRPYMTDPTIEEHIKAVYGVKFT